MTGIATQTSVHRPAMISCLRPVALTTFTTFSSCQVFTQGAIDDFLAGKHVGDLLEEKSAAPRDHAGQNGWNIEGFCQLRQRGRAVDHSLRVVAVEICELIGLVIDQNENGNLRVVEANQGRYERSWKHPLLMLRRGEVGRRALPLRAP